MGEARRRLGRRQGQLPSVSNAVTPRAGAGDTGHKAEGLKTSIGPLQAVQRALGTLISSQDITFLWYPAQNGKLEPNHEEANRASGRDGLQDDGCTPTKQRARDKERLLQVQEQI